MKLPKPIASFIEATNKHNSDEFLAIIEDTAIINDEGHAYCGIDEIKRWSDEKVFGAKVTLDPLKMIERRGSYIVTAKVHGNFDKTGLPDPLVLDFHFTITSNKVIGLSIRFPNRSTEYLKALGFWMV